MRLLRRLESWGYPTPERQIHILDADGLEIARADLGWSDVRVGLEYDSDRWHGPRRWASDEERHQAVVAAGWSLLHAELTDLRAGRDALRTELARVWPPPAGRSCA